MVSPQITACYCFIARQADPIWKMLAFTLFYSEGLTFS